MRRMQDFHDSQPDLAAMMRPMHAPSQPPRPALIAAIVAAVLAFGSAFPAVKLALASLSPGPLALVRFAAASIALGIYLASAGWPRRLSAEWRTLVFLAVANVAAYHILFNYGQRLVSPSAASILVNTSPLWSSAVAVFVLGEPSTPRLWIGLGIAFVGAAAIAVSERGALVLSPGALLVLGAAFLQGVSFIVQRPTVSRIGAVATTAVAIWIGTALLAVLYGTATLRELPTAGAPAIAAAIYVGVVSSVVGLACWAYVLGRMPASEVSPFLLLVPVVATTISLVMLRDIPRMTTVVGGIATLTGVLISTLRARSPYRTATAPAGHDPFRN